MARVFIEGNEAIARGAIRAGCDFFAGYPITPASSILHFMMRFLAENGGVALQAEDEIASIGTCIGAAMAGRKALTATSGPGISLYSENIGLAVIAETPLVIVDVQRQGPGTGSATKGAQGDVQFVRWSTSGGLPTIALCPTTVAEAYRLSYVAFNLAERFRSPVFLLTSKELGLTRESVDLDSVELPPRLERRRIAADARSYRPHAFDDPREVPPFAGFGDGPIVRVTTSSHDQEANLTTDPEVLGRMIEHYRAKIDEASDELTLVEEDLEEAAEVLYVSYGVTARSVRVAVREARARGRRVSSLVLHSLWPVPEAAIRRAMQGVARVVVPEMNLGQYLREIERLAPPAVPVDGLCRMDTRLIAPSEVLAAGGLA